MYKPLAKIKYCAFERKLYDRDKNFQIEYYVDLDGASISDVIKVKKVLKSIDSITKEDYSGWKKSFNIEDFYKQKEYELISDILTKIGTGLKEISNIINKEFYVVNCDSSLAKDGGRKLKSFEEEIVLNVLNGKPTICSSYNNKHNKH